jgi:hypothetical protein
MGSAGCVAPRHQLAQLLPGYRVRSPWLAGLSIAIVIVPALGLRARLEDLQGSAEAAGAGRQSGARLRRSALAMTDTELKVIAALAIIGLSNTPVTGYSTPAAIGTPSTL